MRSVIRHNASIWQYAQQPSTLLSSVSKAIRPALVRSVHTSSATEPLECQELQLPVPWGHVAAKWWGRQDVRPVLAIHGWLDNAGTFDRLIPLLPRHVGYLAIDLPGHGRSSHFGAGMTYSSLDFLHTIEIIRLHMGWERLSLLAHSMGSQLSFIYSSVVPEVTDLMIGIDVLKPMQRKHPRIFHDLQQQLREMVKDNARQSSGSAPPSYTYAELIERMVKGSRQSVSAECAPHLIDRSIAPSATEPGKFYFSRDSRLKVMNYMVSYRELTLEMARCIRAPHLFIKASDAPFYEAESMFNEAIALLRDSNPQFRLVRAEGKHHIHLTDPLKIRADISEFLLKHRPEGA